MVFFLTTQTKYPTGLSLFSFSLQMMHSSSPSPIENVLKELEVRLSKKASLFFLNFSCSSFFLSLNFQFIRCPSSSELYFFSPSSYLRSFYFYSYFYYDSKLRSLSIVSLFPKYSKEKRQSGSLHIISSSSFASVSDPSVKQSIHISH